MTFESLTLRDPSCTLAGGPNAAFDLHVRLYNTAGDTLFDEDRDLCFMQSEYATTCSFDPGSRKIEINKHRWAFVCDEDAPDKVIFASLEFENPILDCDPEGCFDQTGMFTCSFTSGLLDPKGAMTCTPSSCAIDARVTITGEEMCVDDEIEVDCGDPIDADPGPDTSNDWSLTNNAGAPPDEWLNASLDGSLIWPDASHKCVPEIEADDCESCPLQTADYDIKIRRRIGTCDLSELNSLFTTWGINATQLYSNFASADSRYEQTFWITNYSPISARILVTVMGMQLDNQSGASPSPVLGIPLSELGWIGVGKSTVGFSLAEVLGASGAVVVGPFWVCFTVQTKAVSGHTILGTLQQAFAGPSPVADYTIVRMEYQNAGMTAIVIDAFGRQVFPFPDDDD